MDRRHVSTVSNQPKELKKETMSPTFRSRVIKLKSEKIQR